MIELTFQLQFCWLNVDVSRLTTSHGEALVAPTNLEHNATLVCFGAFGKCSNDLSTKASLTVTRATLPIFGFKFRLRFLSKQVVQINEKNCPHRH